MVHGVLRKMSPVREARLFEAALPLSSGHAHSLVYKVLCYFSRTSTSSNLMAAQGPTPRQHRGTPGKHGAATYTSTYFAVSYMSMRSMQCKRVAVYRASPSEAQSARLTHGVRIVY
jgi:hypothetical protein